MKELLVTFYYKEKQGVGKPLIDRELTCHMDVEVDSTPKEEVEQIKWYFNQTHMNDTIFCGEYTFSSKIYNSNLK